MLNTSPEYVSAYLRELGDAAPTARATEALAHRRDERRQKLPQFAAAMYRLTGFGKRANRETKVAPDRPRRAI